jgi:sugar lactone lactonase YvrE
MKFDVDNVGADEKERQMNFRAWPSIAWALLLVCCNACDDSPKHALKDAATEQHDAEPVVEDEDAAEGDDEDAADITDAEADAGPGSEDAGADAAIDAGAAQPAVLLTIAFPEGEPASLAWNAKSETLFVADNQNNQVWSWTESRGLERFATTADPKDAKGSMATNVGQIVQLADGRLVINRFGKPGGGFGAIAYLDPGTKQGALVPNLEENRKRLGLDVAPDGRLFGSYFQGAMGGGQAGAVTLVDLTAGETDYAGGFRKIIGVLVMGGKLYVSDQQADKIYTLPLSGTVPPKEQYVVFASLPRPDQICAGPDGSIFTGQFQAAPGSSDPIAVRQILADGSVKMFAKDPDVSRPSGVAYDAAKRRLFVANGGSPAQQYVRVFSVP